MSSRSRPTPAWAAYTFVKVETDAGITGYGECSDWRAPNAVAGGVLDMRALVIDQDPMAVAALTAAMNRHNQQAPGGTMGRAIAGIECALWDIKGKAYGVPVHELFGGPFRRRVRLLLVPLQHLSRPLRRAPGHPAHPHL